MFEYGVVGSGVGGSSIAALLNAKGHSVALFEKEPYLGGCSSTFSNKGYSYNTGATTLAGYEEGFIVKEIFDEIGFKPNLITTDPSIVIIQNDKVTPRYSNFEQFFHTLNTNYPNSQNREFWELVYEINSEFYKMSGHYYSNSNIFKKAKSLLSFIPLFLKFQKYLRINAYDFIDKIFDGIDAEYLQFLESQILIVAQAPTKEINFFTGALSLGYTFNDNHYAVGGLGAIFDGLTKDIEHLYKNCEIKEIKRLETHFELHTKSKIYEAKKIILNSTVYDSAKLFEDSDIKDYYKKYEKLNNHQSSFMLYMTIKSKKKFEHHYQIIKEELFPHSLSKALFVSFSDASDNSIVAEGYYSLTISLHTDVRFWQNKESYKAQKKVLQDILMQTVLTSLDIEEDEIVHSFCATPLTFKRYINRTQLGGNAITMKNFLPFLPSNDSPIKGVYNVGDSVYAAQGWPGVMLGVKNLKSLLNV
ncbi:NAD(P)-binding protein [Sulfurimonas aquatica]|uniref:NAD(P)-binding protein n=1 Tax=Sulfurimonas aquatica TaxID=2672570 RepID=A0A975B0T3_9BACT|nr:NAD(P)-binding protein [Sulfurimonas aquatica]QSZ42136.1 NAD(P)-binding protein [Sulfurimonas aquatica]